MKIVLLAGSRKEEAPGQVWVEVKLPGSRVIGFHLNRNQNQFLHDRQNPLVKIYGPFDESGGIVTIPLSPTKSYYGLAALPSQTGTIHEFRLERLSRTNSPGEGSSSGADLTIESEAIDLFLTTNPEFDDSYVI